MNSELFLVQCLWQKAIFLKVLRKDSLFDETLLSADKKNAKSRQTTSVLRVSEWCEGVKRRLKSAGGEINGDSLRKIITND